MIRTRLTVSVVALLLTMSACGSDDAVDEVTSEPPAASAEPTSDAPADTEAPVESDVAAGAAGGSLVTSSTDLGEIVVDGEGNTVYLFVNDSQSDSTCYEACAATWPAVGEIGDVGEGLDASLLGTSTRTDGSVQATYNGWPLYYFANDAAPGDTNGQGVGEIWYVVDPAGNGITG